MLYRFAAWAHHAMPGKESLSTTSMVAGASLYLHETFITRQTFNIKMKSYDGMMLLSHLQKKSVNIFTFQWFLGLLKWYTTQLKRPQEAKCVAKVFEVLRVEWQMFLHLRNGRSWLLCALWGQLLPQICPRSAESAGKISAHIPREIHRNPIFPNFSNIKIKKVFAFFYTYTLMCRAYWRLSASLLLACRCQLCSFNHNKRLSVWPRSRGSPTCRSCDSCVFVFFGLSYCAYYFRCLLTRWE